MLTRIVGVCAVTGKDDLRGRLGKTSRWRQVLVVLLVLAIPVVVAVIAAETTPSGSHVDTNFFVVLATVGPLVGLALFIDITVVINQVFVGAQGLTKANKTLGRILVYTNAALLVMSEAFALFAVGSKERTTFLIAASVSPLLLQLWLLTEAALFKIHAIPPAPG